MSDPITPVSPQAAIVTSLDAGINRVRIDKDKTDVVYVEPYRTRSNTRAYLNEYETNDKTTIIRNHREVHYNRIDLAQLIEELAVVTPNSYDQLCHVIHTASIDTTSPNLNAADFCTLLNNEYDIPILPTDLVDTAIEGATSMDTALGAVYRTMNCVITDVEVAYSGGTITSFDNTLQKGNTHPGFVLTREWTSGETLNILPNENIDKSGWSIELGFNNDVDYTTALHTSLVLRQDSKSEVWQVVYNDEIVAVFNGTRESGVAVTIGNRELTIETIGGVTTSVIIDTPDIHYTRGIMRITAYTSNPYPSLYKLGFDVTSPKVVPTEDLTVNNKNYVAGYNLITSDPRSNAVFNGITYPVSASPYKALNYIERAEDVFKSYTDSTYGMLSTFVKPKGFNDQKVTFLLGYNDGVLPADTVAGVLITITDTRNVNNKLYVKTIITPNGGTLVGTGPSINALVYASMQPASSCDIFSVTIAAGNVEVTDDELVIGRHVSTERVSTTDLSVYKVDIEINVKKGSRLPNIDVI